MGSCIFRGNCALIALSFARIRSRRVLRSSKERTAPRFDADVGEPEKRKCFRLPQPTAFAAVHSRATKLDQPRLFRMQRKRECFQTRFEVRQKRLGLFLVLETADNVVGVAHDYHLAASLAFPPLSRPEVKNEMETLAMACPGMLPSDSRISSRPGCSFFRGSMAGLCILCRRFTYALASGRARLEVDVVRDTFIVMESHHVLLAGPRRTPEIDPLSG